MKAPSLPRAARILLLFGLGATMLFAPQNLRAEDPPTATREDTKSEEENSTPGEKTKTDDTTGKTRASTRKEEEDYCRVRFDLEDDFLSKVSRGLYTSVCASSRWFDSFFGNARAYDENSSTYGSVSFGLKWTEYDNFEPILRARINFDLPNARRKLNLFVGRVDPDEYVQDNESMEGGAIPISFRNEDEQWIFGLGTTPLRTRNQRISFQVGLRASLPLDPYAKAQYRWYREPNTRMLFRYRQTLFWYEQKGFGTTTNLDLEYRPRIPTLFRLSGRATIYEKSKGWEWRDSIVAFHRLSGSKALGCRLWVQGKTKADVSLEEYGAWVFFRRRLHRQWLFTDFGTGVSWPREKLQEVRKASWGMSAGLQIQFGPLIEGRGRPEDLEEIPDPSLP